MHRVLGLDFGDGRAGRPTSCAVRAGGAVVVVVVRGRQTFSGRPQGGTGTGVFAVLPWPWSPSPPLTS